MATLSRTQQQTAQLGQLLKTAGGRQKLAASLGPSLRRRRDYMSIARKALMVETLPDGALPIYDKEFDTAAMTVGSTPGSSFVEAFVVGEEGGDIVRVTKPKRVTVPTFEIVSNSMADGFGQVQRHDLSVAFVFFNPRDYTDLLKWTQQNIDRETQRKLLKTGVMGYLWGATLLQSRKVGYGSIYILADAEFLGVIPERIPLTVMSADRPDLRQIGFSIFENLGFLVFNPSGIQRLTVNGRFVASNNTGEN